MNSKMRNFLGLAVASLTLILVSCASDIYYNAKTGNIAGMQKMLESGASIEQRDNQGNTPLMVAVYSNKPEMVTYLCKKGANVNAQNYEGSTALIAAAYYNLIDVAKVLIKYNPDKSLKDKYGNTALDYAVQYNYTEMISLLRNK